VELLNTRKTGFFEEFRFAASNYFTVESRERIRGFLHATRAQRRGGGGGPSV
jgi:hypothetical protein